VRRRTSNSDHSYPPGQGLESLVLFRIRSGIVFTARFGGNMIYGLGLIGASADKGYLDCDVLSTGTRFVGKKRLGKKGYETPEWHGRA